MSVERVGRIQVPKRGVTLTCPQCGKLFYVPQCRKETTLYCSRSCVGRSLIGERNPFYGKHHSKETKAVLAKKSAEQRERGPVLPTKPEKRVHGELRRVGLDFQTEVAIGHFCVDILVPSRSLVIFVDGCYWHRCPIHFPSNKRPRTDRSRIPYLTKCGYTVAVLWEHDIEKDVCQALKNVLQGEPPIALTS